MNSSNDDEYSNDPPLFNGLLGAGFGEAENKKLIID